MSSDLEMGSIGYMYNSDLKKVYFVYDLDLEQWEKLTIGDLELAAKRRS